MENSLNWFQGLVAWLTPQEWLILLLGVGIVFWAFVAYREVKKEENARKQEKTRDTPS